MIQTDRPELIIGWLKSVGRHDLKWKKFER